MTCQVPSTTILSELVFNICARSDKDTCWKYIILTWWELCYLCTKTASAGRFPMLWREENVSLQFRRKVKASGHPSNALVQSGFIFKVGGKVKFCLTVKGHVLTCCFLTTQLLMITYISRGWCFICAPSLFCSLFDFCHFKLWSWMNLSTRATTGRADLSQYLKAACGSIRLACPRFTSRSAEPCSYIQFYLHATPRDFPPIYSDFRLTRQQAF